MGCPSRKVTNVYSGSALMRDLDHALSLIEAVVVAVDVPVTLKTRLGWDEAALNAPELARRAGAAGIAMVTIHGRTRCQFYKGAADWAAIAAVDIPLLANGDITGGESARGADAFGRRWGDGGARGAGPALASGADRGRVERRAGARSRPRGRHLRIRLRNITT